MMYSSNNPPQPETENTIFSGPSEFAETTVPEASPQLIYAQLWNDATEKEYLTRVKKQATQAATKILEQAMKEANEIRIRAEELGYKQGEKTGKVFIENKSIEYIRYFEAILTAMEEHSKKIFSTIEQELINVIYIAVEKITGILLTSNRKEIIQASFTEAMKHISTEHTFTIYVNPEDNATMKEVLETIQEAYPISKEWVIRTNQEISIGSCRFEDSLNTVDIALEQRKQQVLEILSTLQFTKESNE